MYKILAENTISTLSPPTETTRDSNPQPILQLDITTNTTSVSDDYDKYIHTYCTSKLPILSSHQRYYYPYCVAKFLATHKSTRSHTYRLNVNNLICYLIQKNAVPVKRTTLFKLVNTYKNNVIVESDTWSELTTSGRKAFLSPKGFNSVVSQVQEKTQGGIVMPFSKVSKLVHNKIVFEWRQKNKNSNETLPSVSNKMLRGYVMRVMSQRMFSIHSKVSVKTETRSTAEWSYRSTISFATCVAATHFLPDVTPSPFHRRKRDVCNESKKLWDMVENEYKKVFKRKVDVVPVLPNLVTSTDETTMFVTSGVINEQERIHITSKPTNVKNPNVSSSSRNNYTTNISGDSNCRGLRIVLNTTFTAGGISAPIFVAVHGLSLEEMPRNDIVTISVPNLVVGSDRDIYTQGNGFVTFVRGSDADQPTISSTPNSNPSSKDARLANLYRKTVYYPFISKIRQSQYGHVEGNDIPDSLQVVSWMDGAHAQLKLLTNEENLKIEKEKKITICKHSAARTAVEQAADCAPCFKSMKRLMKQTDDPHVETNPLSHHLNLQFTSLENKENDSGDIVRLKAHKKRHYLRHCQTYHLPLVWLILLRMSKKVFSTMVKSMTNIAVFHVLTISSIRFVVMFKIHVLTISKGLLRHFSKKCI